MRPIYRVFFFFFTVRGARVLTTRRASAPATLRTTIFITFYFGIFFFFLVHVEPRLLIYTLHSYATFLFLFFFFSYNAFGATLRRALRDNNNIVVRIYARARACMRCRAVDARPKKKAKQIVWKTNKITGGNRRPPPPPPPRARVLSVEWFIRERARRRWNYVDRAKRTEGIIIIIIIMISSIKSRKNRPRTRG